MFRLPGLLACVSIFAIAAEDPGNPLSKEQELQAELAASGISVENNPDIFDVTEILFDTPELCLQVLSSPLAENLYARLDRVDIAKATGSDGGVDSEYLQRKKVMVNNQSIFYVYNDPYSGIKSDLAKRACLQKMLTALVYNTPELFPRVLFAGHSYFQLLEFLIAEHVFERVDKKGNSVLHYVAADDNFLNHAKFRMTEFLDRLPETPVLMAPDKKGQTPVFLALQSGQLELADALIAKYGLENAPTTLSVLIYNTPGLLTRVLSSRKNYAHLFGFLRSGHMFEVIDEKSNSILHYVANDKSFLADANLRITEFLNYLPETPVLMAPNKEGATPVFLALRNGQLELADALISRYGLDKVQAVDPSGNTLWHYAALSNNTDLLRWLWQWQQLLPSPNTLNDGGDSPLHLAMREDSLDAVKFFAEHGGDFRQKNRSGELPLLSGLYAKGLSASVNWVARGIMEGSVTAPDIEVDSVFFKEHLAFHSYQSHIDSPLFQLAQVRFLKEPCGFFSRGTDEPWPLLAKVCQPGTTLDDLTMLMTDNDEFWRAKPDAPFALSPMHLGAIIIQQPGKEALFTEMLERGVELDSLDAWGYTIADHLVHNNRPELLFRLLLHKKRSNHHLHPAFTNTIIRAVEADSAEMAAILQLFWFPVYGVDIELRGRGVREESSRLYIDNELPCEPVAPERGINVLSHVSKHHDWVLQYPGPAGKVSPLDQALLSQKQHDFSYASVKGAVTQSYYITHAILAKNESLLSQYLSDGASPNEWMPYFASYAGLQYLGWWRDKVKRRVWSLMLMFGVDIKEDFFLDFLDAYSSLGPANNYQFLSNYFKAVTQTDITVFNEKTRELADDLAYWEQTLGVDVKLSRIHPVCTCLGINRLTSSIFIAPPSLERQSRFSWSMGSFPSGDEEADMHQPMPYCQKKAGIAGEAFTRRLYEICGEYGFVDI